MDAGLGSKRSVRAVLTEGSHDLHQRIPAMNVERHRLQHAELNRPVIDLGTEQLKTSVILQNRRVFPEFSERCIQ